MHHRPVRGGDRGNSGERGAGDAFASMSQATVMRTAFPTTSTPSTVRLDRGRSPRIRARRRRSKL